ncbi:MAG: hypothetical protein LH472_08415 [Pyrinomonadaceae bacterium]|nr:hypothetical protein [Pyrinomonadaceae bacterium]
MMILMQTANTNLLLGFVSEPLGVLVFAIALIGCAVGLRWLLEWNEELTEKARNIAEELLEKTLS